MRGSLIGTILFWLVVLGASAAAFTGGFWYTYDMTVDVHTKSPVADDSTPKPGSIHLAAQTHPTATPTLAPGPIPVPSIANPSPPPRAGATPTPMAMADGLDPSAEPSGRAHATPTPESVRSPQATVPSPHEEIYRVQVGAFDSREAAQKQVEELQTVGINAVVVWDGGAYHAQLGAFSDRARAISVADEVNTRGYSVTIRH